MSFELEICIACDEFPHALENARAAAAGGADRLECCADMSKGGLTPDPRIIEAIREATLKMDTREISVLVMVRPRDGGFDWSDSESNRMKASIREMAAAGADGIVSGGLWKGRIDRDLTTELVARTHAADMQFSFHRAIDATQDRRSALFDLKEVGCDRILSSGTSWESGLGALDGIQTLKATAEALERKVELVIGGGISASTTRQLLPSFKSDQRISFHAYSSVLKDGVTNAEQVRELRKMIDAAR